MRTLTPSASRMLPNHGEPYVTGVSVMGLNFVRVQSSMHAAKTDSGAGLNATNGEATQLSPGRMMMVAVLAQSPVAVSRTAETSSASNVKLLVNMVSLPLTSELVCPDDEPDYCCQNPQMQDSIEIAPCQWRMSTCFSCHCLHSRQAFVASISA